MPNTSTAGAGMNSTNVAQSPTSCNSNPVKKFPPRHHVPPPPHQPDYFDWLAELKERIPDPRSRDVLVVILDLCAGSDRISRHNATLAAACGMATSTFRRHVRQFVKDGHLTIVQRRVRRDYNAPNTFIVNDYAGIMGGGAHFRAARALKAKAKYTQHPPTPQGVQVSPISTQPRTRHIARAGVIARKFCDERRMGGWARQRIAQRIEDMLNAGLEEAAIVAELDREHQAKLEAAKARPPHRGTWRRRDNAAARLAAINAACVYRAPETPEELAADQERQRAADHSWRINLAMSSARVREETLRHGQCTQADIDEGFRLVAEGGVN